MIVFSGNISVLEVTDRTCSDSTGHLVTAVVHFDVETTLCTTDYDDDDDDDCSV